MKDFRMRMRFLMPIAFLAMAAVFSAVVMLLWNWLMPAIFGIISINFWQALGIIILCRILFGNFGGRNRMRHAGMGYGMRGRNAIREKWMKMTPEQREALINKRRHAMRGGMFGRHDFFSERDFFGERDFDFDESNAPKGNE